MLSQTIPNERCICVHRRHHSDHHTQPGCQRHCVDENLERRNHYLDLAGIENYTSRFGAGKWTRAKGIQKWRRKGENADNDHLKLYLGSALLWHLLGAIRLNYQPTVPHRQYKHLGSDKHNTSSVKCTSRRWVVLK